MSYIIKNEQDFVNNDKFIFVFFYLFAYNPKIFSTFAR